jgi:hypothetical protein
MGKMVAEERDGGSGDVGRWLQQWVYIYVTGPVFNCRQRIQVFNRFKCRRILKYQQFQILLMNWFTGLWSSAIVDERVYRFGYAGHPYSGPDGKSKVMKWKPVYKEACLDRCKRSLDS